MEVSAVLIVVTGQYQIRAPVTGSHQDDEEPSIRSTDTPYRIQTPLHPGASGSEIDHSQRDPREGEPCRPFDEVITNDGSEEMDEGDFHRLMEEWLAE